MKKYLFSIIVFFCLAGCLNQPKLDKDLLLTDICNAFQRDEIIEPDSTKVDRIFEKHIGSYLKNISPDSAESLYNFFYIRLQRECVVFKEITDRLSGEIKKSDWRDTDIEPESELSKDDYDAFFRYRSLKYLTANGDTVTVHITDSTWQDNFLDGTYSRLSLVKTEPDQFVISFIESNNIICKNFSKPGDKYRYKIVKKEKGYYAMFTQSVGSKMKSLFKLYY